MIPRKFPGLIVLTMVLAGHAVGIEPVMDAPPVLAGSELEYPPFCIVREDGRADGFSVELLREALAAMGRNVRFRTGPWAEVRSWLIRGEVEALPLLGRTPEREALFDFTVPYLTMHGAIVVRQDTYDIRDLNDLRGRRVAVMHDDNAEEFLRREDRGIDIVTTLTFADALLDLAENRVEAVVIQRLVALRLLAETGLSHLKILHAPIPEFRQDFCFAVREGDRKTLALLNEGLALVIADGTYRRLHAKWFASLELPPDRPIIVGGDQNYPPFEYLDEAGRPTGFSVELTRAIAREAGLDVRIRLGPWAETVEALHQGDIDALQGMLFSHERNRVLDFSPRYLVIYGISIVRQGEGNPPTTFAELEGRDLVVQAGDAILDKLLAHGVNAHVTLVENQEDIVRAVAEGRHDFGLSARMPALHAIHKNGWTNLVLGTHPLYSADFCYAVPAGHAALLATFSEGLAALRMSGEYQRLYDKWLSVYYPSPLTWRVLFRYVVWIAGPLLVVVLLALLWSWGLRRQLARRTSELAESESRHRLLSENMLDVIWSMTPEARFTYVNSAIHSMSGFTPREWIGTELRAHCDDTHFAQMKSLIQGLTAQGADSPGVVFETEILHRVGHAVPVEIHGRVVFDDQGVPVSLQGITRDITTRNEAEAALRESEGRFRSYVENAPYGGMVVDGQGRFIDVNPTATRMTGYSAAELTTMSITDFLAPEGREAGRDHFQRLVETGTSYGDIACRRADGETRIWTISATRLGPDRFLGFMEDITERLRAQEDIRTRSHLLEKIFEVLPIGLWQADKEGTLLRGNPAGVAIWGAEPHVPISEYGIFKAWRLPDRTLIRAEDWALAKTIRSKETIVDELIEIEAFDGKHKIVLNYTAPLLDANGALEGAIIINLDISDRVSLEQQLVQAQKMESVGRLAGGVAHDFNNLIMAIMGYVELAQDKLPAEHPVREDLEEILKSSWQTAALTHQLLAFARKETIAPKELDLNDEVGNMLKMMRRLIGEDIGLAWMPGANLGSVKIDPGQLNQLLANLCINARDAIADVGKITIETETITLRSDYCATHADAVPGDYVLLSVSDDGCGMREDVLANVFEPFFTTKGVGEGTGLGLATVYGIVRQNNGFIHVYSEPGQGTTFRIYFPRSETSAVEKSDAETSKPAPGGTETILLVEDDAGVRKTTARFLDSMGYTVLSAETPEAALRQGAKHAGAIDLLLTDVVMPGMNGRELSGKLCTARPAMQVLYMSGYTASVIAHRGILEDGVNFLAKPFTHDVLAHKVREVLDLKVAAPQGGGNGVDLP